MLKSLQPSWLVARAWLSLIRFDIAAALLGRTGLERGPSVRPAAGGSQPSEREIVSAIATACCFYWRPVLCLQRSVCTVRLLRVCGHRGKLVVGYRVKPFMSHAWVEVNGRVADDSSVYAERMRVLHVA